MELEGWNPNMVINIHLIGLLKIINSNVIIIYLVMIVQQELSN